MKAFLASSFLIIATLVGHFSHGASVLTTGSADNSVRVAFQKLIITVGKSPGPVAVADVNHDGKLDLLIANTGDETLTVLLGDGEGHFTRAPGSLCRTGRGPNDIAVGDFNGDGHPDLVIANTGTPYLTLLLGDGKGSFRPSAKSPFATDSHPHVHGVVAADFNRDGKLDAVTESWGNNKILLLLGDGAGNLATPGVPFDVGKRPYERLRTADFNHDGDPDVVTTDLDENAVTILLGDGHGGFRQATGSPFAAGVFPWAVAIGDINKDGNLDLAVLPYDRDIRDPQQLGVSVLLGDGTGKFRMMSKTPLSLSGCRGPDHVAIGDVNGDGHPDIVVSCAQSNNLFFFLGTGSGEFQRTSYDLPYIGWSGMAVADLNGDKKEDVVVSNFEAGTVTVLLSK
ncbi:MAG TPA: VCBS repeat-containing protein [Terriglobales bacterium]|nr:VCBS repeat-containing protein [Terriglobales bacterium]